MCASDRAGSGQPVDNWLLAAGPDMTAGACPPVMHAAATVASFFTCGTTAGCEVIPAIPGTTTITTNYHFKY